MSTKVNNGQQKSQRVALEAYKSFEMCRTSYVLLLECQCIIKPFRGEKEARKIGNIVSTIIDLSCFNIPRSIHYSFGLCSCVACQKLIWIYHDTFSILIDRFSTALHCNIPATASEKRENLTSTQWKKRPIHTLTIWNLTMKIICIIKIIDSIQAIHS